jgi:hypothetical protein
MPCENTVCMIGGKGSDEKYNIYCDQSWFGSQMEVIAALLDQKAISYEPRQFIDLAASPPGTARSTTGPLPLDYSAPCYLATAPRGATRLAMAAAIAGRYFCEHVSK